MKIIITESQMDKQVLFTYWDTIGKENMFVDEYELSIKMLDMQKYSYDNSLFVEWWGFNELLKYFNTLDGKKFKVGRNGYDFDVELSNFEYQTGETFFECEAYTDYKGDIMMSDGIYNIGDVKEKDYLMDEANTLDEIRWEMRDIINEFFDVKIPGGFILRCIEINFN